MSKFCSEVKEVEEEKEEEGKQEEAEEEMQHPAKIQEQGACCEAECSAMKQRLVEEAARRSDADACKIRLECKVKELEAELKAEREAKVAATKQIQSTSALANLRARQLNEVVSENSGPLRGHCCACQGRLPRP